MLHAAADHGAAYVRIFRDLIADDDQLQIRKRSVLGQLRLQGREGLDDARHVLVRTDAAGVKQAPDESRRYRTVPEGMTLAETAMPDCLTVIAGILSASEQIFSAQSNTFVDGVPQPLP